MYQEKYKCIRKQIYESEKKYICIKTKYMYQEKKKYQEKI